MEIETRLDSRVACQKHTFHKLDVALASCQDIKTVYPRHVLPAFVCDLKQTGAATSGWGVGGGGGDHGYDIMKRAYMQCLGLDI